ncbi:MAG: acetyl-CoA decarbonylase/synthase complex subunit alpha/beta [Dehalococcoidia bacterium]|nr:acetyl-CoA decarbonylase/synthase complex subunit alpha/beta [Dehalococcoidia bacterium]
MSEIIASAAIRGARSIVERADKEYSDALPRWGAAQAVGFPNTAYYLPIIYAILGLQINTLGDIAPVLEHCKRLLPPPENDAASSYGIPQALDAGMAALFAEEIIETLRYMITPSFYTKTESPTDANLWLGAADDVILRRRGVEFVDGSAPGFATILGAAPSKDIAAAIAAELQRRNLYIFMCGEDHGISFSEQLRQEDIQVGWPSRLVPFGPDISSVVFAIGFAVRVAMSLGGIKPGDAKANMLYNKERVFAFAMPLGEVTDEWYANAAGAINFGFPIIADSLIPEILASDAGGNDIVVSNVPHDKIVARALDARGLKINVTTIPIPVAYGPAYEGERIRGDDIYLECGGGRTQMVEWCTSRQMDEVDDGKIEVIGPELSDISAGTKLPLAIVVEVAGRQMQEDYEPILERQIHHLINYAHGIMHLGQRDIAWLRVGKQAAEKGFAIRHLGVILHAKLHQDFERIVDKLQVKIYTDNDHVQRITALARAVYAVRDPRIDSMTDETTDTYYSCTLCQSFAPSHVCIVSPERAGLCGSYNWMDCKASHEINPNGPNQPVRKGELIDPRLGQWQGVNAFIMKASRGNISSYNSYSIIADPATACGCMECIAAILPLCNGIMTVNRDFTGMTPSGMKFTTLASTIGGGSSTPGFIGHSKYNIAQRKYLSAEGGIVRLVWMPKMLKDEIRERFNARAAEIGIPDLLERIADESIGITEEEILPFLTDKAHPALTMESIM